MELICSKAANIPCAVVKNIGSFSFELRLSIGRAAALVRGALAGACEPISVVVIPSAAGMRKKMFNLVRFGLPRGRKNVVEPRLWGTHVLRISLQRALGRMTKIFSYYLVESGFFFLNCW